MLRYVVLVGATLVYSKGTRVDITPMCVKSSSSNRNTTLGCFPGNRCFGEGNASECTGFLISARSLLRESSNGDQDGDNQKTNPATAGVGRVSKSWSVCASCTDGQKKKSCFFKGMMGNGTCTDAFTGQKTTLCNVCKKCPMCESCFVRVSPYSPLIEGMRIRRHQMLLYSMSDSRHKNWLIKITPSPPTRKAHCLNKLVDECGFRDIVARELTGPLIANVSSRSHERITVAGAIFSEIRDGKWEQSSKETFLVRANKTQIVRIALFHFLFAAGDGLPKNVLLNPDLGSVYLIDNLEDGLCDGCTPFHGSVFYPGNFKYYLEESTGKTEGLVVYQRHVKGSKLGDNYPQQLKHCLDGITSSTVDEVQLNYALSTTHDAFRLKERATWMLGGFESAIWKQFCKYFATPVPTKNFLNFYYKAVGKSIKKVKSMQSFLQKLKEERCLLDFNR